MERRERNIQINIRMDYSNIIFIAKGFTLTNVGATPFPEYC